MPDDKPNNKKSVDALKRRTRQLRVLEIVRDSFYRSSHIAIEYEKRHGVKVPSRTIRADLATVNEWLRRDAVSYLQAAIGRELLILGKIEREAWEAWERSKLPAETKRMVKRRPAAGDAAPPDAVEETLSVEQAQQNGDPRYLDMVLKVHERKCKLFGLDAPEKIDLLINGAQQSAPGNGATAINEIRQQLLQDGDYLDYLRQRAAEGQQLSGQLGISGPVSPTLDAS